MTRANSHTSASADPTSAGAWRGPTEMGTVGSRYQYVRFHDRQHWIVVDTAKRETYGHTDNAWDAGLAADHLNRGLPVEVDPEPTPDAELTVRNPRAIAQGLALGVGAYFALVGIVAALGPS